MMTDNSMLGDPNAAAQQAQQQAAMQPPQPMEQETPQEDYQENSDAYTDWALSQANLAKGLKDKKDEAGNLILDVMASEMIQGYMADEKSREPWMEKNKKWLELSLLIAEDKTWPWPRAANIKYPLLATAAMQFSARAYPALVPSDGSVVKAKVAPKDPSGELTERAARVARHMSWQIMSRIPKWEESMDKLLMTMAISGIAFKKTYHDGRYDTHCSHLVYPENFCVNYWAKDLESAYRKTEILFYNQNEVREKQLNDEEFLDVELPAPSSADDSNKQPIGSDVKAPTGDKSTPHKFIAVHTFWDLDDDGYEEPYIVTIHLETKRVVRIIARWDSDGVEKNDKGDIKKITPVEYFTAFPFIPNPDGSIYACGFGMLLSSLNNAANTLINQLIDAGTMNNLQSGFIGRNLRMKEGQVQLRPNEWKVVNASGEDLQKSIYPIPTKEPSAVLMNLLQMLVTSGNQLASIAEIFVGKMPGQNTPASTTQETVQQGMAVFTAVYKRVYRSLNEEFYKIYRLNRITPGMLQEESMLAGVPINESDYEDTKKFIIPGGDPSGDTNSIKQQKYQQVGQLIQLGTINAVEYTKRVVDGLDIPQSDRLVQQPPPPPPDPKMQSEQMKQQTMQMKAESDMQMKQADLAIKQQVAQMDIALKQFELQHKQALAQLEMRNEMMMSKLDQVLQVSNMQHQQRMNVADEQHAQVAHQQELNRNQERHDQQMQMAKQKPAAQPKAKAKKTAK